MSKDVRDICGEYDPPYIFNTSPTQEQREEAQNLFEEYENRAKMRRQNSPEFCKNDPDDIIWWVDNGAENKGEMIFSFDRKERFNLFSDYPHKLTTEQKEIFDRENPFWADFFSDRQ